MKTEKFLEYVQERSGLPSEDVKRVVEAALETLGERLEKTEREKLAAQLPDPLKEPLLKRMVTERYSLEELYNRISARADVGYPEAVTGTRAVMGVLQDSVSRGEIDHILRQLPDEYEELFGATPEGPLSPTKIP